jgi:hypothetical protein
MFEALQELQAHPLLYLILGVGFAGVAYGPIRRDWVDKRETRRRQRH